MSLPPGGDGGLRFPGALARPVFLRPVSGAAVTPSFPEETSLPLPSASRLGEVPQLAQGQASRAGPGDQVLTGLWVRGLMLLTESPPRPSLQTGNRRGGEVTVSRLMGRRALHRWTPLDSTSLSFCARPALAGPRLWGRADPLGGGPPYGAVERRPVVSLVLFCLERLPFSCTDASFSARTASPGLRLVFVPGLPSVPRGWHCVCTLPCLAFLWTWLARPWAPWQRCTRQNSPGEFAPEGRT